jgi:hypothetical protein
MLEFANNLEHSCLKFDRAVKFWKYFTATFLQGSFPLQMWNHFDSKHERTNNRVEEDNYKMKVFCGAADPNIDKAVGLLQQFEAAASDKYINAKKSTAKAQAQDPDIVRRDESFKLLRNLLRNGRLDLEAYKSEVLDLHKFEAKKKYYEELEDTDESDDTDNEEGDSDDDHPDAFTPEEVQIIDSLGDVFADFGFAGPVNTTANANANAADNDDAVRVPCRFCGKLFKPRGMNRHINSAHQ